MKTLKLIIITTIVLLGAYTAGFLQGKLNERNRALQNTHETVIAATRARISLNDPDFVRRLREKYSRR